MALRAWPALGFGHVEVGTVTAHPQPGNARPRLFRLVAVAGRDQPDGLQQRRRGGACRAAADRRPDRRPDRRLPRQEQGHAGGGRGRRLPDLAARWCTGTPTTSRLTCPARTPRACARCRTPARSTSCWPRSPRRPAPWPAQDDRPDHPARAVPVLVKIAPDLSDQAIDELLGVCVDRGIAGVIATNTTLSRHGIAPGRDRSRRRSRAGCPGAADRTRAAGGAVRDVPRPTCRSSGSAGS